MLRTYCTNFQASGTFEGIKEGGSLSALMNGTAATTTGNGGIIRRDNSVFYSTAIQGNYAIAPATTTGSRVGGGATHAINTLVVQKQEGQKVFTVQ